jgi:hypothetical protein
MVEDYEIIDFDNDRICGTIQGTFEVANRTVWYISPVMLIKSNCNDADYEKGDKDNR